MSYQSLDLYKTAVKNVLTDYCKTKRFGRKATHFDKANNFLITLTTIQNQKELTEQLTDFYFGLKTLYSSELHDRLIMVLGEALNISEASLNAYCRFRRYYVGTWSAAHLRGPIEEKLAHCQMS